MSLHMTEPQAKRARLSANDALQALDDDLSDGDMPMMEGSDDDFDDMQWSESDNEGPETHTDPPQASSTTASPIALVSGSAQSSVSPTVRRRARRSNPQPQTDTGITLLYSNSCCLCNTF